MALTVASCTSSSSPRPIQSTALATDSAVCVDANRVVAAISAFQANRSRTFDSAAKATANKLISEAKAAAQHDDLPGAVSQLKAIASSVQSIVAHASGSSPSDIKALKQASAQYLTAVQDYETLVSAACGITPSA